MDSWIIIDLTNGLEKAELMRDTEGHVFIFSSYDAGFNYAKYYVQKFKVILIRPNKLIHTGNASKWEFNKPI